MAPKEGDTAIKLVCMLIIVCLLLNPTECLMRYGREELLHVLHTQPCTFDPAIALHKDILLSSDHASSRHYDHPRQSKRKRGKRAGALVKFRRRTTRPPLPSILLANVQSINNKTDEFLQVMSHKREYAEASAVCLTETWLVPDTPDSAFTPPGFTAFRADRCPDKSGKQVGGGICLLVNKRWCTDTQLVSKSCSSQLETVVINCRPFYSPREFHSVVFIGVYIDPSAPPKEVHPQLNDVISKTENSFPNSTVIVCGDFNHISLKKIKPDYHQQINLPTHNSGKTLDHCYTVIKHAFKAVARPRLGISDHIMVLLLPVYKTKLKDQKPVVRTVRKWTDAASEKLQDCLEDTDWDVFRNACPTLDEYSDTITSYINFCYENCVPSKEVKIKGYDKPWFNSDTRSKLEAKLDAAASGDPVAEKKSKYDYEKSIRTAKAEYGKKVEKNFEANESRKAWQGVQIITDYKSKNATIDCDPSLPNELNVFYGRFDRNNTDPPPTIQHTDIELTPPFIIQEHEVKKMFQKQNPHKAAGPDGVPPIVLKACSNQLAPIFTEVFNSSLTQRKVPQCFKTSCIVPVPKKPTITRLNDYRPVALTSVIMKVLEKFVLNYLKSVTKDICDPHQFAYQSNRSVDDAVALGIHYMLQHLDTPNSYVRMLFVDYSSAFNTIIPGKLYEKFKSMNINIAVCDWVLDFLLNRPQSVKIGKLVSDTIILNTGAPQGCVLSPILFTLFTNDCVSHHPSVKMIKFSDDTTLEGLISNDNEYVYRREVEHLVKWCDNNNLELNVSKTKEVVIDFRTKSKLTEPLIINDETVEQVKSFKFLGTVISDNLKWDEHITTAVKKANQRMFFLRQLKKFRVSERILMNFYRATIESILTFSITVWFCGTTEEDKKLLNRVMKYASKIIGTNVPNLEEIFTSRAIKKCVKIMLDKSHPSAEMFQPLKSGHRLRALKVKTNRSRNSFYPRAVMLLNESQGMVKSILERLACDDEL